MTTTFGPCQIRIDGILYNSKEGKWDINIYPQSVKYTMGMSANKTLFRTAEFVPSTFKGTLMLENLTLNINLLMNATEISVVVSGQDGRQYILSGASYTGDGSISPADGELPVEFSGYGLVFG